MTTPCFRVISLAALIALFARCSQPIGGAGGETTNGRITGIVKNEDGSYVAAAQVRLFPVDYDPVKKTTVVPTETTDSLGRYAFANVTPGGYNIQAVHVDNGKKAFVAGIRVAQDTVTASVGILGVPGAMKVSIPAGSNGATGYFYVPGTGLFVFLNNRTDFAVLDSVPAGTIPRVSYSSKTSKVSTVIRYDIPVISSDTAIVRNPSWNYRHTLVLNTFVTGADVTADIVNFPVLIRLNSGNFDFLQALANGADLRFAKHDTVMLPYEIERWDPAAGVAEVWVKVDTVHGNDSTQSINMYWGNPAAPPRPDDGTVFDTADGFQGVWHMGDAAYDSVFDATANRYQGYSPDTARPAAAEGVIGKCRAFDGVDDYVTMPGTAEGSLNFPQYGYYTVSAWVFIDTFSVTPQLIVSKGYEQYFLWSANYPAGSPFWEFNEFNESTNWESSRSPAAGGQWLLLIGVRQGENQFLFCNGVLVDSVKDTWSYGVSKDTLNDLSIGGFLEGIYDPSYEGYCFFRGSIDEVRVISAAQNPAWVRLCYMNQRSDDRLVIFK